MSDSLDILIMEALIHAVDRRDQLLQVLQVDTLTDEELIRKVAKSDIVPRKMNLLVSVCRLLRLMDALLTERETGEGFVSKFSQYWLSLQDWDADPTLEEEFDRLNQFYSEIQMFCASAEHRQEEPLLFGLERLKELTQVTYKNLKQKLYDSLLVQQ